MQTGLLPTLLKSLTQHSTLAQRTSDAAVLGVALAHLLQCRVLYRELTEFMKVGRLPQAVRCGQVLKQLLDEAPEAVAKAKVTADLKVCDMCWRVSGNADRVSCRGGYVS